MAEGRDGAVMRYLRRGLLLAVATASVASGEPWNWTRTMPSARYGHVLIADEARHEFLLFGGDPYLTDPTHGETWIWDGTQWRQKFVAAPGYRRYAAAAYDSARKVTVLFGGTGSILESDTWEWNGKRWEKREVPGPSARFGATMSYDSTRGVCVLFGGWDGAGYRGDTWEWNGTSWVERPVPGPAARGRSAQVFDPVRHVTVLSGGISGTGVESDVWEWDGNVWANKGVGGPGPRFGQGLVWDSDRSKAVLFGGSTSLTNPPPPVADVWEWDGNTWTQRAVTPGISGRASSGVAYDSARHLMWVFAGQTASGAGDQEHWSLDIAGWHKVIPNGPSPSQWSSLSFDENRHVAVMVTGGSYSGNWATWELFQGRWKPFGVGNVGSFTTVYDSARQFSLLVGATKASSLGTPLTLKWDAGSWISLSNVGPSGRAGHALAFDRQRGVAVMFGGYDDKTSSYSDETWEWDGQFWAKRAVAGPTKRAFASMAYDEKRGRCILFGGGSPAPSAETWEWDGISWSQRSVTGPAARYGAGMAYDPLRHQVVVSGGRISDLANPLDDTWAFDGTVWRQLVTIGAEKLAGQGMTYDRDHDRFVLFGPSLRGYAGNAGWYLVPPACPADLNRDRMVDDIDFAIFTSAYDEMLCDESGSEPCDADLNGDWLVDDADFQFFVAGYGAMLCE